MNIEELKKLIAEKESERAKLKSDALELLESDELEKAQENYEAIQKIDKEIAELKKQLKELEEQAEDESENEEEEQTQEGEIEEMPKELRSMEADRVEIITSEGIKTESAEVRDFKRYLETRDTSGGSLTTESGFVVVPEEVITDVMRLKGEQEYNLDRFVTVRSVNNGSGKFPVVRESRVAALPKVEELAENPELAVKPLYNVAYDIATHRGYFRVSRETIEDSSMNVLEELTGWLAKSIAATRNAGIIDALLNGTRGEDGGTVEVAKQTATSVDDIKDAVNLHVLPNYTHNVAIMSQSAWATVDKLKDNQGNYLVQPDVKEASAKRFLGARVEVLPDEVFGEAGNQSIIIGNLKDAIVLFNRSQYQAGWTDYMHFGEALMVALRQDVRILDENAAIVLTLDGVGEPVPSA